ncbi:Imm1 family immunity protein [Amycolatopsis roodepoortensis]|uniref:Dehydrogenase n=1 Tax=Amycolatopsis roodepoortensis TaxID=700274 RepID=A0ABR9LK88_9PSEU|nr:Imm1 family immunity protein [Amycolatopsis roodepoortensis]MBE1580496.1 putative dehydrogenase [Amycolatopsis roodepoortensis]
MTSTLPDLDAVRRDNTATVATLRAIPDAIGLLRSAATVDPDNGEPLGIVWDFWSHHIEDDQPMMRVGLRGNLGVLRWYTAEASYAPAGTTERDGDHEYWHGGYPQSWCEGEEIPAEYVYAAVGEFIATGQRPTVIRWINTKDVPNLRTPAPTDESEAAEQVWRAAAS